MVVMAFDERGQAGSLPRRTEICERSYRLLTTRVGVRRQDIIFDPNILTWQPGWRNITITPSISSEATR